MHFSKDMKYPLSDKKNPELDFSNLKAAVVKKILYIYNGFLTVEQWKIKNSDELLTVFIA